MMKAMGIIFANIYDSSLGELTNKRTIASLPYGGGTAKSTSPCPICPTPASGTSESSQSITTSP